MKELRICLICLCLLSLSSAFAEDYLKNSSQTGISGYVIEKLSGKPLQDVEIIYRTRRGTKRTTTDANGFFMITGLDIQHKQSIYIIAKNFASQKISIMPVAGKIIDTKIELMPSSKVAGFIKDENDSPVANAKVEVFQLRNQDTKTDANGFYEIDGLDPDFGQYSLAVKADSFSAVTINFPPSATGQTAKLDIVLKVGIIVFGRVTDPYGNPLQGAVVGNTESRSMWNHIEATSDANGFYELQNIDIDNGQLVLWAVHPQYPPYVETFNIDARESEKQINIRFENPKPLHGKVVNSQGNPVSGVNVIIREIKGVSNISDYKDRIITDAEGKFTIENAPSSGKVVLQIRSQTVPNIMPEIEIGKDEHIIEVQQAGRIYGQVIDNATGKAVSKFNVKLGSSSKSQKRGSGYSATWSREGHDFNDSNGFFDTGSETLPIGAGYIVTVYAQGYDLLTIDPVEVLPTSNEPNRIIFKLMPPAAIEGSVVNEQNEPVVGASVRWFSETNRLQMYGEHWDDKDTTMTDSNGRFAFDTIGSGKRGIYITASGFAPYIDADLILPDDKEELYEIVLEKSAEVFGTIYKDGKPAAGIKISCDLNSRYDLHSHQMGFIEKSTVTNADGNYCLSDLPAGNLSIYTMSPIINRSSHTTASKKVILSPGQKINLDFGNEQGFTVTGQVCIGQTPLSNANVFFRGSDYSKSDTSNSNGFFKITGLAKGKYNVSTHYRKPQVSSTFSSRTYNPEDELRDNQQIDVNSDTTLNIDFGSIAISGKIPPEFIGEKNLRLMARRWNPKSIADDENYTYKINWDYINLQPMLNPNGSFTFSNLKPGRYYLTLIGKGLRVISESFEIDNSQQPNNIKFINPTAKLQVTVIDAESKKPLDGAACGLTNDLEMHFFGLPRQRDVNATPNTNRTDANGIIEYDKLPPAKYTFMAAKDGFLTFSKDNIQIEADKSVSIEIALEKSAVLKFIFDDAAKKLITKSWAHLICKAINLDTQEPYTITTFNTQIKKHFIFLQVPQEYLKKTPFSKPNLNLPTGRYRLEYELFQHDDRAISKMQKPFLSGQTEVDIKAGQTIEVIIK